MKTKISNEPSKHKWQIKPGKTLFMLFMHTFIPMAFYSVYYLYWHLENWPHFARLLCFHTATLWLFSGIGVTVGAHRLWSHKSFKAKLPLRIFLAIGFDSAGQHDLLSWVRDHRLHHKYSETDLDPHNARRGLFFSHIGWMCCKKHPDCEKEAEKVDLSDLYADPVVMFEHKYYYWISFTTVTILPILVPYYLWSIPFWLCFLSAGVRYIYLLHATCLVNSFAHHSGSKPYDKHINPTEQDIFKWLIPIGEFYHNYHHTFPNDYKASEWGWMQWNISAAFIELMALIGQAYDLKTTPPHIVAARKQRTGQYAEDG